MTAENINAKQDEIIIEFSRLDDWFEKYEYLINLGQTLPDEYRASRIEQNQINGCQSQVWLKTEQKDDRVYYTADSDALITRGILALLLKVLNGQRQKDIKNCDLYFINKTGLASNLSPSRANGLSLIVKQMMKLD